MIHELNEIIRMVSPDQIIHTVRTISPDEVIMRISSNYNQIEATIRNYPIIKNKTVRIGRIVRVRCRNRLKKMSFIK